MECNTMHANAVILYPRKRKFMFEAHARVYTINGCCYSAKAADLINATFLP